MKELKLISLALLFCTALVEADDDKPPTQTVTVVGARFEIVQSAIAAPLCQDR